MLQKCLDARATVAAFLLVAACGARTPELPKPGTPEFFWAAAHANFSDADFEATHRNLDQLTLSDNPHRSDAAVWLMVLLAGQSRAAMDLAAVLQDGSRASGRHKEELDRQIAAVRKTADQYAMHLAELVQVFHSTPNAREIPLAFVPPDLSAGPPPEATRVRRGVLLKAEEAGALRTALEKRAIASSLCRLANTGSDFAKARTFLTGEAKLTTESFEWYLAQELFAISELYSPQHHDQPARASLLLGEAARALAAAGDAPEARQLARKVSDELKKIR